MLARFTGLAGFACLPWFGGSAILALLATAALRFLRCVGLVGFFYLWLGFVTVARRTIFIAIRT